MNSQDVRSNLCTYDERNPCYIEQDFDEDIVPAGGRDCYCDNCFYGRNRLALEILSLQQQLISANICTEEDFE